MSDLTVSKVNDSNAYWVVDYYPNINASSLDLNTNSTHQQNGSGDVCLAGLCLRTVLKTPDSFGVKLVGIVRPIDLT